MDETLVGLLAGAAGFLAKSMWDYIVAKRQERDSLALNKRVERLERQLSEFFWPVYLRLQKDNAVWEKILDKNKGDDELRQAVGHEIEKNTILPNHDEIVSIIESKAYLAEPDQKLSQLLQQYLRHVAVYKSMRSAGCYDKDPIYLSEPWPSELFEVIETRTLALQKQYESYLRSHNNAL